MKKEIAGVPGVFWDLILQAVVIRGNGHYNAVEATSDLNACCNRGNRPGNFWQSYCGAALMCNWLGLF